MLRRPRLNWYPACCNTGTHGLKRSPNPSCSVFSWTSFQTPSNLTPTTALLNSPDRPQPRTTCTQARTLPFAPADGAQSRDISASNGTHHLLTGRALSRQSGIFSGTSIHTMIAVTSDIDPTSNVLKSWSHAYNQSVELQNLITLTKVSKSGLGHYNRQRYLILPNEAEFAQRSGQRWP